LGIIKEEQGATQYYFRKIPQPASIEAFGGIGSFLIRCGYRDQCRKTSYTP